jgi:hypothetical protein
VRSTPIPPFRRSRTRARSALYCSSTMRGNRLGARHGTLDGFRRPVLTRGEVSAVEPPERMPPTRTPPRVTFALRTICAVPSAARRR